MPSSHVDSDGQRVRQDSLGRVDVDVAASSRRRRVETRMVGSELTTVGVHSASDFASLLVAPANRSEVGLVVHEARVELGIDVRVG